MSAAKALFEGSLDRPTMAGLGRLLDRLNRGLGRWGFPDGVRRSILVVVDELVSNTLNYRASGDRPQVEVTLREREDGSLELELRDNGRPFDPFQVAPPKLEGTILDRPVGGVGIAIVRHLAEECHYSREGEWNRVRLGFQRPR